MLPIALAFVVLVAVMLAIAIMDTDGGAAYAYREGSPMVTYVTARKVGVRLDSECALYAVRYARLRWLARHYPVPTLVCQWARALGIPSVGTSEAKARQYIRDLSRAR